MEARHFEGDVSVGRNMAIGGEVSVSGSVRVEHDVRVRGKLEADNIVGAVKGLFLTVDDLRHEYPVPQNGWLVGVLKTGTGSKAVFEAYISKGKSWIPTGKEISLAEENFDITLVGPQQTVYEFTGTPQTIALTYFFFKDGQAVTPTSMSINGTPITPVSSGTTDVQINSPAHHTFTLTATVQGVTKSASVSVDMECPMFLGFAKEDRTIDYLKSELNKVVALSAKGIYTYSNDNEDYHLTICIPSSFTLNDVLSSGISVPLMDVETDEIVIGTTPCIYNIYRSVLPIVEGAMNFVIIP